MGHLEAGTFCKLWSPSPSTRPTLHPPPLHRAAIVLVSGFLFNIFFLFLAFFLYCFTFCWLHFIFFFSGFVTEAVSRLWVCLLSVCLRLCLRRRLRFCLISVFAELNFFCHVLFMRGDFCTFFNSACLALVSFYFFRTRIFLFFSFLFFLALVCHGLAGF